MGAKKLILPLLFVTACSGSGPVNEQASSTAARPDSAAGESTRAATGAVTGVRLAKLPDSREGDAAAAAGTLRAEGSCLYLEAADATRYLIAFTIPGARWDADREALVVPAEEAAGSAATYPSGSRVTLSGSEARADTLSGQWVEPPAAACETRRIWVTNSIGSSGND